MEKQIAHQKLIRDKMQKEDAWNLFGEWWKDVDTDIKKAVAVILLGVTYFFIIHLFTPLSTSVANWQ